MKYFAIAYKYEYIDSLSKKIGWNFYVYESKKMWLEEEIIENEYKIDNSVFEILELKILFHKEVDKNEYDLFLEESKF